MSQPLFFADNWRYRVPGPDSEHPGIDSIGFDEIKKINFKFEGTPEQRKNWTRWLADIYPLKTVAPAKAKGATSQRKR